MKLQVESFRSDRANVASGTYDVAVVAGSWDSRSLMFAESDLLIDTSIVLTLTPGLYSEVASGNQDRTLAHARRVSSEIAEIEADRQSPFATLRAVVEQIRAVSRRLGRPLKILIDLAGTSRFVSLGVMAATFRDGSVLEIDFMYGVAMGYGAPLSALRDGYVFRSGAWLPTAIPGLGAPASVGSKQHLIVSAGFEGRRTRRLVDLLEPDYVTLIGSMSPSTSSNKVLEEQLVALRGATSTPRIAEMTVQVAEVSSIVEEIRPITSSHVSAHRPRSNSVLLGGPKSTSLGLAIAALEGNISNVFYVQSERHEEVDVSSVHSYYLYRIGPPWRHPLMSSMENFC